MFMCMFVCGFQHACQVAYNAAVVTDGDFYRPTGTHRRKVLQE